MKQSILIFLVYFFVFPAGAEGLSVKVNSFDLNIALIQIENTCNKERLNFKSTGEIDDLGAVRYWSPETFSHPMAKCELKIFLEGNIRSTGDYVTGTHAYTPQRYKGLKQFFDQSLFVPLLEMREGREITEIGIYEIVDDFGTLHRNGNLYFF